jgi:P-type Ca2+ transporter type 2C
MLKMGGNGPQIERAYYQLEVAAVLRELGTSHKGLLPDEAVRRLEEDGPNRLATIVPESRVRKYLRQWKDAMIILLVASSFISWLLGDGRTALVLFVLAGLNTAIGFFQEYKAEQIMDSLRHLVVPEARVLRGGTLGEVPSTELVVGDVIYIEAGDSVPADLRLVQESELSTNDFAMTGESQPTRKFTRALAGDVPLAERRNLAFMGTTVATGNAHGVVIGTGMQTELGRIASLSQAATSGPSPLQREMGNIAVRVTQATLALCLLLLLIAIQTDLSGKEAFLFAVGVAASLLPNGLPAAISTVLAEAAGKLAKRRALVKKLSAVETLGATNIICTDKTGTLTKNEMTVEKLFIGKDIYSVSGTGYQANGHVMTIHGRRLTSDELKDLELVFAAGVFASNARVSPPDEDHPAWHVLGDPTEGALITLANKGGLNPMELEQKHRELKEFSFDSVRKRMSAVRQYGANGQMYVFAKGAPESILERCDDIWDQGHVRRLGRSERQTILQLNEKQAEGAMRNLALAYRVLPAETNLKQLDMETAEDNLVYLGMVSMIDPLRDEVPAAMDAAHLANVKVSVITGDHATTAKAIAGRARLNTEGQELMLVTGDELRTLEDSHVLQLLERGGVVFSRVSPEDKLRIVGIVKARGHVVAVTGDGINDAPALKTADIGVAMGVTGTDVAKQSAEIVLLDDSFNTLIGAIQEGRIIFANIKKITLMSFAANASELFVNLFSLAGATLLGIPLALSVLQILAIDLIAELFPLAALGWDRADRDLMRERPRNLHAHILNKLSALSIAGTGLLVGALAYGNYLLYFFRIGLQPDFVANNSPLHMRAMTMTYLTIVFCMWVNILHSRSHSGVFTRYQLHNPRLWAAFGLSMLCVLNIVYTPVISGYFNTAALGLTDWLFALGAAGIFLAVIELIRHSKKHGHTRSHVLSLLQEKA